MPHPPKLRHIGQTVNGRACACATCRALQTLVARRCKGHKAFGQSSAEVLLTTPPTQPSWALRFCRFCRQKKESRRADLRTADLSSSYEFACARSILSRYVRKLCLFRRFSAIWRSRFVHCVPVRISPVAVRVAVHAGLSIRAWDDASGIAHGMTEVGARHVPQSSKELIVCRRRRCAYLPLLALDT
jgi:hypothetical protein